MQEILAFTVCPFWRKRMMSTRRTLLTFGALVATVALLIPTTAAAQAPTDPTAAGPATVVDYDSVVVQWTPAGTPTNTTGYEVGYAASTAEAAGNVTADTFALLSPKPMPVVGAAMSTLTINGLTPATYYIFGVRAVNTATATPMATDRNGPWVMVDSDTGTNGAQGVMTAALPAPGMPRNVALTAYNGAIGVTWDAPQTADPIGVHHYKLRATFTGGTLEQGTEDGMTTEHMFMDLMNGTEYSITVETIGMNPDGSIDADMDMMPDRRSGATMAMKATPMESLDMPPAMDDDDDGDDGDDDDDDDMMATPALPLFGILALFAGLLAAGRARLRP